MIYDLVEKTVTLVRPAGAVLTIIGLALAAISFGNYHQRIDSWIADKLPNPIMIIGLSACLLFIFDWATDFIGIGLMVIFGKDSLLGLLERIRFATPYLLGIPAGAILASTILYYMARAKGGFMSSVALIVAIGSVMTLLGNG